MALCSYFEVYLAKTVKLALRSDPATLLQSSKAVDGVRLLRSGQLSDYKDEATSMTKGTWSARVNSYYKCFGYTPPELSAQISELDQLRVLRNGVGHAFGRDINEYESHLVFEPKALQRLSEKRLKKWLGIVEKVVDIIYFRSKIQHS